MEVKSYNPRTQNTEQREKFGAKMDNPNQYYTKRGEQTQAHEHGPCQTQSNRSKQVGGRNIKEKITKIGNE